MREICQQWFLVVTLGDPKQLGAGQKWMLRPADVPGGQPAGRWALGSSLWSHGWRSQERDQEALKVTRYQTWYPSTNQKPRGLADSEKDSILRPSGLSWSLSNAPGLKTHFIFESKVKVSLHISRKSMWLQLSRQQRLRSRQDLNRCFWKFSHG